MNEAQLKQFYDSINKHLSFLNDVSLNANGNATIKLITATINKYSNSEFIKNCVSVIDKIAKNDYEFCKTLFEISCCLIEYRRDPPGHEIVFTPKLAIQVGKGDCKKFTTWICCILKCKGFNSASKVVNYEKGYGWQHIYAIAFYPNEKGYLTIDPVNKEQWNTEVKFRIGRINFYDGTYSKLIMNKLSLMGNLPNEKNASFLNISGTICAIEDDLETVSGINPRKKFITPKVVEQVEEEMIEGVYDSIEGGTEDEDSIAAKKNPDRAAKKVATKQKRAVQKTKRIEKRKKIVKGSKKVGFAPARAAFISLIYLGQLVAKTPLKFNLAQKLAEAWMKDGGASLKAMWIKVGGKPEALRNAIIKASKTKISGIQGTMTYSLSGIGVVSTGVAIASITAAAPILGLTIKILHEKNVMNKEAALKAVEATELIEQTNTDKDGNLSPEAQAALSASKKLVEEALKTDDKGDKQSQDAIKTSQTSNDASTPGDGAKNNSFSSSSSSDSTSTPSEPKKEEEKTEEEKKQTAAGFQLFNASSWLTGSLTVPIMASTFHNETAQIIGTITSSFLFVGAIVLTLKSFFK